MMVEKDIKSFLEELSSSSPAPGGGSVAALSGALSASLVSMMCNLTIGKKGYEDVSEEMGNVLKKSQGLKNSLISLIDEDTHAFNQVMKAYRMPKTEVRSEAIQDALKKATHVPLNVMRKCDDILSLAKTVAEKGNVNSITDAGVSAIMAAAGIQSASLNVRINLSSIRDQSFTSNVSNEMEKIIQNATVSEKEVLSIVDGKLKD